MPKASQLKGLSEVSRLLVKAANQGSLEEIEALVKRRPEALDRPNSHGNTPLRAALANGHIAVARHLVALGANPKQINHGGSSLLEVAAIQGSEEAVMWLASLGLSPRIFEYSAVGSVDRVKRLLAKDESLAFSRDRRNQTPLHWAARGGHVVVIDLLIEAGADVRAEDKNGHEPLAAAVESGQATAVSRLLHHGANANARGGHFGGHVLHRAVLQKNEEAVRALLDAGADPNRTDASGKTVLHDAISVGRKSMVVCLLEDNNVSLEAVSGPTKFDKRGETPLEYATHRKRASIAELIRAQLNLAR